MLADFHHYRIFPEVSAKPIMSLPLNLNKMSSGQHGLKVKKKPQIMILFLEFKEIIFREAC